MGIGLMPSKGGCRRLVSTGFRRNHADAGARWTAAWLHLKRARGTSSKIEGTLAMEGSPQERRGLGSVVANAVALV